MWAGGTVPSVPSHEQRENYMSHIPQDIVLPDRQAAPALLVLQSWAPRTTAAPILSRDLANLQLPFCSSFTTPPRFPLSTVPVTAPLPRLRVPTPARPSPDCDACSAASLPVFFREHQKVIEPRLEPRLPDMDPFGKPC